jgi:hypothetical protein
MAVVLGLAAVVLLALAVALSMALGASGWWAAVALAALLSIGSAVAAALTLGYRRISHLAQRELLDVAGPAIIESMSPRLVLDSALNRVFGRDVPHGEILTAVLGGSGRNRDATDTAVSKRTEVVVELDRVDEKICRSVLTWSHEFSGVRNNHLYLIFGTSDWNIYTTVMNDRIYPLYEVWFLPDDDQFENFVPDLRKQLEFGISYRDEIGALHTVEPRREPGEVVPLRSYEDYVELPSSVESDDLRILKVDLYDLADLDHVVAEIETLSVRASSTAPFDDGFITWTVPYPCYVESVTFDVSRLAQRGERLVYLVVSSTLRAAELRERGPWIEAEDTIEVAVESWMLTGHGVTLLWRPVNGSELQR